MKDTTPLALVRYVNSELKAGRILAYGRERGAPGIQIQLEDGQRVEATTEVTQLENGRYRREFLYDGLVVSSVVTSKRPSDAP